MKFLKKNKRWKSQWRKRLKKRLKMTLKFINASIVMAEVCFAVSVKVKEDLQKNLDSSN